MKSANERIQKALNEELGYVGEVRIKVEKDNNNYIFVINEDHKDLKSGSQLRATTFISLVDHVKRNMRYPSPQIIKDGVSLMVPAVVVEKHFAFSLSKAETPKVDISTGSSSATGFSMSSSASASSDTSSTSRASMSTRNDNSRTTSMPTTSTGTSTAVDLRVDSNAGVTSTDIRQFDTWYAPSDIERLA